MKFRKKPVVIDADLFIQAGCSWPLVTPYRIPWWRRMLWFRMWCCKKCGLMLSRHGWIDTLEGGHIACPGDWIITGVKGERYPCKPDIFEATHEPVEEPRMTTHEINRVLAPIAGYKITYDPHIARTEFETLLEDDDGLWYDGDPDVWSPATDSNHLREVLDKLTNKQQEACMDRLASMFIENPPAMKEFGFWLLTCDPRIIAQAVAEVVAQSKM